jgi:tRNA A37 methylthiotransferase MiaB
VGKEYDVVVTGWGREAGMQMGRTPCHRIVHFATDADPVPLGSVTRIRIAGALSHSLKGERLSGVQ